MEVKKEKEGYKKQVVETILESLPWGGYAMVQHELTKKDIKFSIAYIKKILTIKTEWWNIDIINAAMTVCNNHLDKIKSTKQTANDLIEKINQESNK